LYGGRVFVKSFLSFPKRLLEVLGRTFAGTISLIMNTKIQLRLTVLFIVLSVIPCNNRLFLYKESAAAITSKTSTYSAQVMNQIAVNIKTELDRLENDSVEISLSELAQNVLINAENMSEWEIYNIESTFRDNLVKKFSILHDVSDVLLFTNSGKKINAYGDRSFKLNFRKEFLDDYLEQLTGKKGTPVCKGANHDAEGVIVRFATSPEQMNKSDCILLGRAVLSLDTREIIGTLIIRQNERYFSNITEKPIWVPMRSL
jgi:two-component system sensor histidine kinase YesM